MLASLHLSFQTYWPKAEGIRLKDRTTDDMGPFARVRPSVLCPIPSAFGLLPFGFKGNQRIMNLLLGLPNGGYILYSDVTIFTSLQITSAQSQKITIYMGIGDVIDPYHKGFKIIQIMKQTGKKLESNI